MNAAAASDHARTALGKIDEIHDLSRNKLSQGPEKHSTTSERWLQYLRFMLGIVTFLSLK